MTSFPSCLLPPFISLSLSLLPSSPPRPHFPSLPAKSLADDTLLSWLWRAWWLLVHHPRWKKCQDWRRRSDSMSPVTCWWLLPSLPTTHKPRLLRKNSPLMKTLISTASLLGGVRVAHQKSRPSQEHGRTVINHNESTEKAPLASWSQFPRCHLSRHSREQKDVFQPFPVFKLFPRAATDNFLQGLGGPRRQ